MRKRFKDEEDIIKQYMSKLGKKGGKARLKSMTAKERSAIARKAVQARWKKHQQD